MERARRKILVAGVLSVLILCGSAWAVDSNGLVAHWQFEEGEGSIAYDSAGDNHGTIYGASWATGVVGGALDFDGYMDYVRIPDDASLTPASQITIAWWVYNRGGQPAGIYKYASCPSESASPGNSRAYGLGVSETHIGMQIFAGVNTDDSIRIDRPVSVGEWHHVAGTFNAGDAALYLDGEPQICETLSVSSIMNDVQPLIIGGHWEYCGTDSFYSRLNGKADDVRIYNRALTAEEIRELFVEALGGRAYWPEPADGAVYVDPATLLGWEGGAGAVWHDVYLGTDFNDVNDAGTLSTEFMDNVDVNSFDPCGLELLTTYYWRIDEVNGPNTVKGDVWSFRTWLEPNLIAWWKFDEGEGLTAHDSAGNNDGALNNGPVWTLSGINGALMFDGTDDYVEAPELTHLNKDYLTVTGWIYPVAAATDTYSTVVFIGDDTGGNDIHLALTENLELFCRADGGAVGPYFRSSEYAIQLNTWQHIACVFNNTTDKVYAYIDGETVIDADYETYVPSSHTSYTQIGRMSEGGASPQYNKWFFPGMIDDVRVYNRALATGEIQELYGGGLGGRAWRPEPADGAVYVDPATVLGWEAGEGAVSHDVYLGTDYNDVNDADTSSAEFMDNVDVNTFDPCGLELLTTYYWRIDEVNGPNVVKGDVWSFRTWLEPNLIAWWKFDEGEGLTAYDSAGNNDGTLTNGPMWTASGIDGSLFLDGVDDYVGAPDSSCLDFGAGHSFTCTCWIRFTTSSDGRILYKWGDDTESGYALMANEPSSTEGSLAFLTWENNTDSDAVAYYDGNYNDNDWHFVAGVRDQNAGQLRLFVDGVKQDEVTEGQRSLANSADLHMGTSLSLTQCYQGFVDDVRIYNRALSAEEIGEIYESGTPVNYYYVDGVYGDDLNDGLTPETAFATIQKGVAEANDADTVVVYPAVYAGPVSFEGKAITVQGVVDAEDAPVISAPGNYAVSCFSNEDANSVLKNFVVKDSFVGVFLVDASPTLAHLTVVDNNTGVAAYADSEPHISNCIFYNNDEDLFGCEAEYSFAKDGVTDGLVAHWKFDEGQGSIAYDSAGDNDGILFNGPIWTSGQVGGALRFDGTNDYVVFTDIDQLDGATNLSIGAWVNTDSILSDKLVARKGQDYPPLLLWVNADYTIHFGFYYAVGAAYTATTAATITPGQWFFVAGTYDGDTIRTYINGTEEAANSEASGPTISNSEPLSIGCGYTAYSSAYFNGLVDDVHIYNCALSGEEVGQLYRHGLGPLFVDADGGDYHLKSEGWRWAGEGVWMWDGVSSPCIDSGNPGTPLADEPMTIPRDPNNIWGVNIRVNMGAYGGTSQASIGPHGWALLADLNNDGVVDWLDVGLYAQCWLMADYEPAGDLNRDGSVDMLDWALVGQDWAQQTIWR